MDSKLNVDSRMADLDLRSTTITAVVSDIPGASINAGDLVIDMTKFAASGEAEMIACELILVAGNITATVTNVGDDFTADFGATAVTATDVVRLSVKRSI